MKEKLVNKEKLQIIIDCLEELVEVYAECCGEDDEINYKPVKEALDYAREIMADLEK